MTLCMLRVCGDALLKSRPWNKVGEVGMFLHLFPFVTTCEFCFPSVLFWFRGFHSHGNCASTKGLNSSSTELEAETITWPLWAPCVTGPRKTLNGLIQRLVLRRHGGCFPRTARGIGEPSVSGCLVLLPHLGVGVNGRPTTATHSRTTHAPAFRELRLGSPGVES